MVLPHRIKSIGNQHEIHTKKRKTTIANSNNKKKITKPKKLTKVFLLNLF